MKSKSRKRQKGEQEVRILPDGRIVFVAPDEAMLNLAQELEQAQHRDIQEQDRHGSE